MGTHAPLSNAQAVTLQLVSHRSFASSVKGQPGWHSLPALNGSFASRTPTLYVASSVS